MTTATLNSSTVRETIEAAFPFSVDKFPLYGPESLPTPHYGLFRDDSGECVGTACRRGYEPHTKDDILALSEAAAAGFDADATQVECHWKNGHRLTIGPTHAHRASVYGTADNIFPRFLIRAGYDGTAFSAGLGLYRDACENLQMLESAGQSHFVKLRHTHHLRDRMPQLVETFRELAGHWQTVQQTADAMQSREIAIDEYLAAVFPGVQSDSRNTYRSALRKIRKVISRISSERHKLGQPMGNLERATAWEAFQGVQGYCQHDKTRKGRPNAAARAWLALDDNTVSTALTLALAS